MDLKWDRTDANKINIYMYDKKGSLVLKAVKQNSIYIVNRIARGLQSITFPASVQQHSTTLIPEYNEA